MASQEMLQRLEHAKRDMSSIMSSSQYRQARSNASFEPEFLKSRDLAYKKFDQACPYIGEIDDIYLQPIAVFLEQIPKAISSPPPNQTQLNTIVIAKNKFIAALPLVNVGIIEASGLLEVSESSIHKSCDEGRAELAERVKPLFEKSKRAEASWVNE